MLLISFGLNAENSALVAGIPSMINIGDGEPRFVLPRTVILPVLDDVPLEDFPTSPGLLSTVIPGDIPCKAFCNDVTGLSANCLGVIVATEPVRLAFFCVPKATTTTSSNAVLEEFNEIFKSPPV
ncbi:hypothetical protein D3C72_1737380 [compost metagenome]